MDTIFETAKKEEILRDVMENYPEYSSPSLDCVSWRYKEMKFRFEHEPDGSGSVTTDVDMDMLMKGLDIFLDMVKSGKYHNNGFNAVDFAEGENWDATDVDALVQCAIFGEIIYG
ncbi:MAG: hypothetical protein QXU18_12295 [Thermoplasmatales archaeon]